MVGWSLSVLGSLPINNLLRPCNQSKNGQNGPNGIHILLRRNGHLISVHLWNCVSTFITKHFLQNLKNSLVAKRTIYGRTLGRPVDWWVAYGDRATVFQQHWTWLTFGHTPLNFSPFPGLWLMKQLTDKLLIGFKFGGPTHNGTPQAWLTFRCAPLNSCHFLASDWSSTFRPFRDKPLIRFISHLVCQLLASPCRPAYLWLVEQFPCIYRQTADQIELKFGGPIHYIWASPSLIHFWSWSTEFPPCHGLWLVEQFLHIFRQTADEIELKFGGLTHYGPPQVWLTFDHSLLNPSTYSPTLI